MKHVLAAAPLTFICVLLYFPLSPPETPPVLPPPPRLAAVPLNQDEAFAIREWKKGAELERKAPARSTAKGRK